MSARGLDVDLLSELSTGSALLDLCPLEEDDEEFDLDCEPPPALAVPDDDEEEEVLEEGLPEDEEEDVVEGAAGPVEPPDEDFGFL